MRCYSRRTHATHRSRTTTSGVALLTEIGRALGEQRSLRYTYRLLWSPGTIGAICWLAQNRNNVEHIRHGLVVSCVGDPGPFTYKRSRRGDTEIDRVVEHVLRTDPQNRVLDWSPYGGDERQFCSPGFDLPVGASLARRPTSSLSTTPRPMISSSCDPITSARASRR